MDEAIDETLLAYMAKRRDEIGEGELGVVQGVPGKGAIQECQIRQ